MEHNHASFPTAHKSFLAEKEKEILLRRTNEKIECVERRARAGIPSDKSVVGISEMLAWMLKVVGGEGGWKRSVTDCVVSCTHTTQTGWDTHYTVGRPRPHLFHFVFFWKFRLPIGLHSRCSISATAGGTCQK